MAISVDSSVARWTGTPSGVAEITSASFTPANNSLLVLCINGDEFDDSSNKLLAVAGGSLTWTERIRRGSSEAGAGIAAIWTAPVTTGSSMTVTVNRTTSGAEGTGRLSAKLYIVTGQHASPIGNSNPANFTTDPQSLAITASGAGRLFGCGVDWSANGQPTSTDTADAAHYATQISVISAYKSADHTSGSQSIEFNPLGTPTGNLVVLEILAAAGGGTEATASPGVGSAVAQGRAPSVNPFTNIFIREVLINEAGSPVSNQSGLHLVVWYSGAPSGAPDLSYSNLTTDANGTASWNLATGGLVYNQGVFYVAHDGHSSMSVYTCARMIPTYQ